MKKVTIQANLFKGEDTYKLNASTDNEIVKAIFVEITENDIKDILDFMN